MKKTFDGLVDYVNSQLLDKNAIGGPRFMTQDALDRWAQDILLEVLCYAVEYCDVDLDDEDD